MPAQTVVKRVESLEQRVTVLESFPQRLDSFSTQVSELRREMRDEFFALRNEIGVALSNLHDEIRAEYATRADMEAGFAALRGEIRAGDDGLRQALNELRAQMLALHEDLVARITLIQEGGPRRRRR